MFKVKLIMLRKFKKNQGMTLIELMIVIVIIGILISTAVPNYFQAINRAKAAEVRSNMHLIQNTAEMYAVDWNGLYPATGVELKTEAQTKNYWKEFRSPFTKQADPGTTPLTSVDGGGNINPSSFPTGTVSYFPVGNSGYVVYGSDKTIGKALFYRGKVFFLTNS